MSDTWTYATSDVPFQRMPNVSLLPGERDLSWEDMIAATDRGIAIVGDGSFSIDQQRYNAQFGGQLFYEIRGGKITGMLKDVAYQMKTKDFWNAMDMIGGRRSYEMGGSFFDGKGQPGQINAVSHWSVPARFRSVLLAAGLGLMLFYLANLSYTTMLAAVGPEGVCAIYTAIADLDETSISWIPCDNANRAKRECGFDRA